MIFSKRALMLPGVEVTVLDLLHHPVRIVADGVEGFGNVLVAFTDLHRGDLLPHRFVEHRHLVQRPGDQGDPVRVQVGNLVQQPDDGGRAAVIGQQTQIPQRIHGLVQVLDRLDGISSHAVSPQCSRVTDRSIGRFR